MSATVLAFTGVVLGIGALGGWLLRRRSIDRRQARDRDDERATAQYWYERLGGQVLNLDPGDNAQARQALTDADERYTAAGSELQQATSPAQYRLAASSAREGLKYVATARRALGLDPGPDLPAAPMDPTRGTGSTVRRPVLRWALTPVLLVPLVCIGGVIVAVVMGTGTASNLPGVRDLPGVPGGRAHKPVEGTLGQPVRDGSLAFTVQRPQCGLDHVGSAPIIRRPKGQYCVVKLSVHNAGDGTASYNANFQKAYTTTGSTYSADIAATVVANSKQWPVVSIQSGQTLEVMLVFDIAAEDAIARLELHESVLSTGATVRVG